MLAPRGGASPPHDGGAGQSLLEQTWVRAAPVVPGRRLIAGVLNSIRWAQIIRAAREEREHMVTEGQGSEERRSAFLQLRVTPQMHAAIARLALDHDNITIRALVMNALKQTYGLDVPDAELRDQRGRQPRPAAATGD